MSGLHRCFVSVLAISLTILIGPRPADACGGFFCSSGGPQALQAVEQTQERVLFQVNDDDTITATVEISFTGDPAEFAWVVPVPNQPDLEIGSLEGIVALDQATAPTFVPPRTVCGTDTTGCRPRLAQTLINGASFAATVPLALMGCQESVLLSPGFGPTSVGVDVVDLDRVGAFKPEYVTSDDPELLINWLNDNGFLITTAMEPAIEGYVAAGMGFLAMKLAPETDVGDIEPIRMTYEATTPMLPIVLTQVAAEPDMSIIVFIGADQRYQAADWPNIVVDPADIWLDPASGVGATNYSSMVSWMVDEFGGRAWVTEFAGPRPDDAGVSDLTDSPYITRLFTRMSGWEMTEDPMFGPSDGHDIDNVRDLSLGAPQDICAPFGQGNACGGVYCGEGAQCADLGGFPGCVCPEGQVARAVLERGLGRMFSKVTCTRTDFNMMEGMPDGLETPPDPCAALSCGNGTCTVLNGFATCACDEGSAATVGFGGGLTCQAFSGELQGPEVMLPTWSDDGVDGLAVAGLAPRGFGLLLGLLVPVAILRRRAGR
jgi:hypothetical protein